MPTIYPPLNFGYVEENIYRSAFPSELNFSFLQTLHLRTIVVVSPVSMNEKVVKFLEQNSIKLICIDSSINSTMGMRCGPSPVAEEIVFDALRVIIVSDNLPTLITCSTGKNITGVVAGCLRKLQRWSLISIFEEYRRYAGYSGSRIQQQHEQFIELFDTDLIKLSGQSPKFLGNTVDHSDHEELTNETTK